MGTVRIGNRPLVPLRCKPRGTSPRARAPSQLPRENPRTSGSSAQIEAKSFAELLLVCAHQGDFRAACAELLFVRTHEASFRARIRAREALQRKSAQILRGAPARARAPRRLPRSARRTLPRGRPPGPSRCRNRIELRHVGEQPARSRIEPEDVYDHQQPLDASSTSNFSATHIFGRFFNPAV
jgi:hypothetical protein